MIDLRQLEADALALAPMLAREIAALEASTAEIDLRQLQATRWPWGRICDLRTS